MCENPKRFIYRDTEVLQQAHLAPAFHHQHHWNKILTHPNVSYEQQVKILNSIHMIFCIVLLLNDDWVDNKIYEWANVLMYLLKWSASLWECEPAKMITSEISF